MTRTARIASAPAGLPGGRPALLFSFIVALASGTAALAHRGVDEQIADLSSRLEREPGSAPLLLRRGELHRAHGDRSAAERDFRAALAADPALHAVHLAWGRVRLEAGDPALALATLDRFIAAQPGHPDALRLRGRALALLGRPWQAADSFTAAIAASLASGGTDPALYLERAAALQSAGGDYLPEALSGLEDGIARLGAPSTLVLAAADLEEKLGRIEAAVARLDGAARNARRPERWRARQGEILEKAGRAEEARRAYEAALFSFAALPESRRRARAGAEIEASVRAALERMAERRGEAP